MVKQGEPSIIKLQQLLLQFIITVLIPPGYIYTRGNESISEV